MNRMDELMRMKTVLKNKKGNALLFAVVTFSVLLIVAIGISVLSAASVKLSTQDRKYNSTYYLAEAGTQKGLQQVKDAVAKYYQSMYGLLEQYCHLERCSLQYVSI